MNKTIIFKTIKDKRIILPLLVISCFLVSMVLATQITTFSNSLTNENLTYSGNQNFTRNLEIYRYSNVTSAYMNLSGHEIENYEYQTTYGLHADNDHPSDIASDGTNIWVTDYSDDTTYKYDMVGNYVSLFTDYYCTENPTSCPSASVSTYGIWTDGTNIWTVGTYGGPDYVYKYDMGGNYVTKYSLSIANPKGITSDGSLFYVVDSWNDLVYVYNNDFSLNSSFTPEKPSGTTDEDGIYYYNNNLYVVYPGSVTSTGNEVITKLNMTGGLINNHSIGGGSKRPSGLYIDGSYVYTVNDDYFSGDGLNKIYKYLFTTAPTNSFVQINNTNIWSYTGEFNQLNNKTNDFYSTLNTALNSGACDCSGCSLNGIDCLIPFLFHSDTAGILEYSDIQIDYESIPNTRLISPANNSYSPAQKTFYCNSTDFDGYMSNLTFHLWNSTDEINTSLQTNVSNEYSFDGNDWVNISSSDSLNISNGTEGISIEVWFKINNYGSFDRIVSKSHTSASAPYTMYGILLDSDSATYHNTGIKGIRMELAGGGQQHFIRNSESLNEDQWYQVVGTYNNSDGAKLYLNGTLVNSTLWNTTSYSPFTIQEVAQLTGGNIDTNDNVLSLGASGFSGVGADFFDGVISEVKIFNRSLYASEVSNLYTYTRFNESTHISNGLVAEYHFNNKSTLYDTANSNDGVLIGATFRSKIDISFSQLISSTGTYHWNCLGYGTNNYFDWADSNWTLNVDVDNPIITLNNPTDNKWLNHKTNIYFNYTPEHSTQTIDTCLLYGNWSGWHQNLSDSSITEDIVNSFVQNLSDEGQYFWNIKCNTTIGSSAFSQLGNFTFNIDTIFPNILIDTITTTAGSQTLDFTNTASDLNLDSCKYSIFDSTGSIDGLNENVSFTCGVETSPTVTAYGTYNLTIYAIDLAENENSSTLEFTTSASVGEVVGGGGAPPEVENIPVIALKQIDGPLYNKLERAVFYARINTFCSIKETQQTLAIQDFSEVCSLRKSDIEKIQADLFKESFQITVNDLILFYEKYNTGELEQVYMTRDIIETYDLFTSVLGITNPMRINPPRLDRPFIIFGNGNFTLEYVFVVNKKVKACSIISGDFECEVITDNSVKMILNINDTDFLDKVFKGEMSITSDADPQNLEIKRVSLFPRVYNLSYRFLGIPAIVFLVIFAILILMFAIFFIVRGRIRNVAGSSIKSKFKGLRKRLKREKS